MRARRVLGGRLAFLAVAVGSACFGALPAAAGGDNPKCPVKALAKADGPVEITFWHVQQAKNEEVLLELIEQFEAGQDNVRVNLVNIPTYPDIFEKYKA